MASLADVARIALSMPEAVEVENFGHFHGFAWTVRGKAFAWERPFTNADLRRFGDVKPPEGQILAVRVSSLEEKDVKLMAGTPGVFTIPHFDGFAAMLIQLDSVSMRSLKDALTDAYLAMTSPGAGKPAQGRRATGALRLTERPPSAR